MEGAEGSSEQHNEPRVVGARRELTEALQDAGMAVSYAVFEGVPYIAIDDTGDGSTANERVRAAIAAVRDRYPDVEMDFDLIANSITFQYVDENQD